MYLYSIYTYCVFLSPGGLAGERKKNRLDAQYVEPFLQPLDWGRSSRVMTVTVGLQAVILRIITVTVGLRVVIVRIIPVTVGLQVVIIRITTAPVGIQVVIVWMSTYERVLDATD